MQVQESMKDEEGNPQRYKLSSGELGTISKNLVQSKRVSWLKEIALGIRSIWGLALLTAFFVSCQIDHTTVDDYPVTFVQRQNQKECYSHQEQGDAMTSAATKSVKKLDTAQV